VKEISGGTTVNSVSADDPVVVYKTASATPPSTPSLWDDFEDGDADGWTTDLGSWSIITEGSNHVYKSSTPTTTGRVFAGASGWADYSTIAKIKVDTWNSIGRAGVITRYTDGDNYYGMYYRGDGNLYIVKRVNGTQSTLISTPVTAPSTGVYHTYELQVSGTTLNAYLDGDLIITTTDSSLSSGYAALYAYNETAYFDDVTAPLLVDRFEDGDATGWSLDVGTWSVVSSGSDQIYEANTPSSTGKVYTGQSDWDDYSVEANIKVTSWNRKAGLLARYADSQNYYFMYYDDSDGKMHIDKRVSNVVTGINSVAMTAPSTGAWHSFRLSVNGYTLTAFVDGSQILSVTDAGQSFSSGKVGLYTFNQTADFDDMIVK
jgi:hypothetical protein